MEFYSMMLTAIAEVSKNGIFAKRCITYTLWKQIFKKNFLLWGEAMPLIICQKQSFADALQKGVLKNFTNFAGKYLCWSFILMKLQAWRLANLLKGDSNTGFFLVKFAKFLRTPFFKEHLRWLLLICLLFKSKFQGACSSVPTDFVTSRYSSYFIWRNHYTNYKFHVVIARSTKRAFLILFTITTM